MADLPLKKAPEANMRWLWHYVMLHRSAAFGALISGVVGGITAALEPYLIGVIIDHVRQGVSFEQMKSDIVALIGFAIVTVVAFLGQRTFSGQLAYAVNFDIRRVLFDNLLTLDQGFYQRFATGDLISRMYSDVNMIWRLLALLFNRVGSALFNVIVTFILLATVNFWLTVVVFIVLAISTSIQLRVGMALAKIFEKVQDQTGVLSALVQDAVSGIQTVKTFGREEDLARKYKEENLEFRRIWLYFRRRNEPVGMLPNMISELTTGIVVLFGGIMTLNGSLTLGNFAQFLIYLALISTALLQLGTIYQRYQQTRGALTRITPLLQHAAIYTRPDANHLEQARGEIDIAHVGVYLEGKWVLRDISMHIKAGSVVAVVGPTGCGKSLLVSLLARVLDPTEGRIRVDGIDIQDIALEDLRESIAYVPQTTFLFSQELHENVRMGRLHIDDDDLNKAIHISRMSNDLAQLPNGLDTLVGEKGVMLSGGQRQRVAIARAIVRDPAILVLDDALSSVDTHTAAEILADLRHVLRSRTSIIIAHRIATVKDADYIFVMSEGRVVEQGTHHDLIEQNGLYAQMVERELKADYEAQAVDE